MSSRPSHSYQPADTLFLWWLGEPQTPVLVAELSLVRTPRGVAVQYAQDWIERGFPLSEDLPLSRDLYLPALKDTAAGAVDDARPDR